MQPSPHCPSPTIPMPIAHLSAHGVRGDLPICPMPASAGWRERRLYTATLERDLLESSIAIFHACRAASLIEVRTRLAARVPAEMLAELDIRLGIDVDHKVVRRLVPRAIAMRLADHGDCCPQWRPLEMGGDLHIQEMAGAWEGD